MKGGLFVDYETNPKLKAPKRKTTAKVVLSDGLKERLEDGTWRTAKPYYYLQKRGGRGKKKSFK